MFRSIFRTTDGQQLESFDPTPTASFARRPEGGGSGIGSSNENAPAATVKSARVILGAGRRRDRKIAAGEKCGGRKNYAERDPELVSLARQLYRPDPDRRPVSLRQVSAALSAAGKVTPNGVPYSASAVASMLEN
jgi:hypothetical protein